MNKTIMKSLTSTETTRLTSDQHQKLKEVTQGWGNVKAFHESLNSTMAKQTLRNIILRGSGAKEYVDEIVAELDKR
jgi:hypothetical protein